MDEKNKTITRSRISQKDRLELENIWFRDIGACSDVYGTNWYPMMVKRFRNDIINIRNGPQLKSIIDEYVDHTLDGKKESMMQEWKELYPQESNVEEFVTQKQDEINMWAAEKLCNFIIQTLENNGICFHKDVIEIGGE